MTCLSACGSASMAAAAMPSAASASSMRARYGARNGSSARRGLSVFPFGRSVVSVLTELEFAQVQFPPHAEIARQAVERMAERRGFVVLEPEVPDPGERVTREHRAQNPQRLPRDEAGRDAQDRAPGSEVMQQARYRVAVLAEVIRVELREGAKTRIPGFGAKIHAASSGTLQALRNARDAGEQRLEQVPILAPRLPPSS